MAGAKRWSKSREGSHCNSKFNDFVRSGGANGWDPNNEDAQHIPDLSKADEVLKPFLSATAGGHKDNRNSDKVLSGFRRSASEFWVGLFRQGIRYKQFRALLFMFYCCISFFRFLTNLSQFRTIPGPYGTAASPSPRRNSSQQPTG